MKIISGGQTGADQGGLRAARALGLPTGGFAAKHWETEDGPQQELLHGFHLQECSFPGYPVRTFANVEAAHGTVWFGNEDSPGASCTARASRRFNKSILWNPVGPEELLFWIRESRIALPVYILNVAGNRESKNPGIGKRTEDYLTTALRPITIGSYVDI